MKRKGERERYIQLNIDFQNTAQREKKDFFNEQCIKLEENNIRGKTRDLFRKSGDIKGTFCPKIGTIKDKMGRYLVDTEEIKKRWKEYIEELYKKHLYEPDYHNDMGSHPEADILESEVKWALESTSVNKASGCNGIPVEQLKKKTLKYDATKMLYIICQQIWKTQQWPQDWKRLILIPVPKKGSTKECANHQKIALIPHTSTVMLKILQARLQHYVKQELPDVQASFRKGRGSRDQIANIHWIIEKAR